jgi:hypothetical protein
MFYDVSYTPVIDSSLDYIHTKKMIIILRGGANEILHRELGIMDKSILATPPEAIQVYMPRYCTIF